MHGETEERVYRPRADIQAAMRILGRRSESRRAHENRSKFRLDLTGLRLRQIDLEGAKLGYAYLGSSDLTDSYLGDADLSGAWLLGVNFDKAALKQCSLAGAAVMGADFRTAQDLLKSQLESASE